MKRLLTNALLVNEGVTRRGALLVDGECIGGVFPEGAVLPEADEVEDLHGAWLMPGVIDTHVHFRDPGLTHKADTATESRAALAGGVTSVMDMPNVVPQTTTNALWEERMVIGARECRVNYAYYLGATNDNIEEIKRLDPKRVPAVKLFMGSSTGNMLVDREESLRQIFRHSPKLIVAHCEDTQRINQRMKEAQERWGDDPAVEHHTWIRDAEACRLSSALAVKLATEEGARLHLAHITTEAELTPPQPSPAGEGVPKSPSLLVTNNTNFSSPSPAGEGWGGVTLEVCLPHLLFTDADYHRLGTRIKCNPSVKSQADRDALRKALSDGRITTVGTDHAPHLLSEKEGGARKAVSGMPMVQFSLVSMLDLALEGVFSVERVVELMCHQPAQLFGIEGRGYLRPGMKADLVVVDREDWTLSQEDILSKCGWSPLEGHTFHHRVRDTYINGRRAWHEGEIDDACRGESLRFRD